MGSTDLRALVGDVVCRSLQLGEHLPPSTRRVLFEVGVGRGDARLELCEPRRTGTQLRDSHCCWKCRVQSSVSQLVYVPPRESELSAHFSSSPRYSALGRCANFMGEETSEDISSKGRTRNVVPVIISQNSKLWSTVLELADAWMVRHIAAHGEISMLANSAWSESSRSNDGHRLRTDGRRR